MNVFDLNTQWKLFLERSGVPEQNMPEGQRREMKRAFFGACGQMLILLRDDVSIYPEDKAAGIMQRMLDQVGSFWQEEMNKESGKLN